MGRLIQKFQERSPRMWRDLLNGFQSGDAPATAQFAHALKGTASNLSAIKVADNWLRDWKSLERPMI